jgi:YD repeat-containing protein
VSRAYPGQATATYAYDDDGRLAGVSKGGATTSYSYDPAGNPIQVQLPPSNGYVETRAYDRAGRVASIQHAKAGVPLASASYVYDAVGNPTSVTTLSGVTSYGYDALDRLVDVCFQSSCPGGGDPFIRYGYDAVGNRTTETRPAGTTSYTYDAGDRLLATIGPGGTTSYGFDATGNQTQAGARTFAYDLANRTASTTLTGATTT